MKSYSQCPEFQAASRKPANMQRLQQLDASSVSCTAVFPVTDSVVLLYTTRCKFCTRVISHFFSFLLLVCCFFCCCCCCFLGVFFFFFFFLSESDLPQQREINASLTRLNRLVGGKKKRKKAKQNKTKLPISLMFSQRTLKKLYY